MPAPALSTLKLREMIKAEELIKHAQDSVIGDNPKPLSSAEVGVIKLLLNKVIPDLKGVEHTGTIDSEQTHVHRVAFKQRK